MRAYNIELFNRNYELIGHANVGEVVIDIDYLSNTINTLTIPNGYFLKNKDTEGRFGDYIVIRKGKETRYTGLTTAIEKTKTDTIISFKTILNIFDSRVVIDTDEQGRGTLEGFVSRLITKNFIENPDELQNISGLVVEVQSATTDWGFNFKSDKENMHTIITNLYHNVIIRAFQKYNLVVTTELDFATKQLKVIVATNTEDERYIEANLDNVINKNFSVKKNVESVNKLVIYNTSDYSESIIYYLHSDNTFDTENRDRLFPVVVDSVGVDTENGGNFPKLARSQAFDTFRRNQNNHLIELEFLKNDKLVDFKNLHIGQKVKIINDGKIYDSVLTGFKIDKTVLLKFGNIRLDLTKILKRGFFNAD